MKSQNIFLVGLSTQTIAAFFLGLFTMYGMNTYGHPVMMVFAVLIAFNSLFFAYWFAYNFGELKSP